MQETIAVHWMDHSRRAYRERSAERQQRLYRETDAALQLYNYEIIFCEFLRLYQLLDTIPLHNFA